MLRLILKIDLYRYWVNQFLSAMECRKWPLFETSLYFTFLPSQYLISVFFTITSSIYGFPLFDTEKILLSTSVYLLLPFQSRAALG